LKVIVPTLNVRCTLREECVVAGKTFKPGAVVTLPYGVALQGITRGTVGVIVDAEVQHVRALEMLMSYGADSWFPASLQTIGKVAAAYAAAETEAKTAVKH
jgi:hypothetical protein